MLFSLSLLSVISMAYSLDDYVMWALLNSSSCGEELPYGPNEPAGWTGGDESYFESAHVRVGSATASNSSEWLQIVYDNSTELFRVTWKFSDAMSVAERFDQAIQGGSSVSYVVTKRNGAVMNLNPSLVTLWRFSSSASPDYLSTKWNSQGDGFSSDDAAWGGAACCSQIDGDASVSGDGAS